MLNHLSGEGDVEKLQDQANVILAEVLNDIKNMAKKASLSMPSPGAPSERYAAIWQGPEENFVDFVTRLKVAIGKQVERKQNQKEILPSLVKENANPKCKRVIKSLPPDPKPTIEQMVEACTKVVPGPPVTRLLQFWLSPLKPHHQGVLSQPPPPQTLVRTVTLT